MTKVIITKREVLTPENISFYQGAIWAITTLLIHHQQVTMAENIFRELGVKWNDLKRKYKIDEADMKILRKYKFELTKHQQ